MKFPLVSRARLDEAHADRARWHDAALDAQSEVSALTEKLLAMQRSGFSLAPPEPPAPPYRGLDPEIRSALEGRFPGNSPHRGMVLRQIDEWLLTGRENSWIARRIWDGEENDDGG